MQLREPATDDFLLRIAIDLTLVLSNSNMSTIASAFVGLQQKVFPDTIQSKPCFLKIANIHT